MSFNPISTRYQQGLTRLTPQEDGVSALFLTGAAVQNKLVLETPYLLTSLAAAEDLGLNPVYDVANSTQAYKHVKDFFTENPAGRLYVMFFADTVLPSAMLDPSNLHFDSLQKFANGTIKVLGVTSNLASPAPPDDGIDADLPDAIAKATALYSVEDSKNLPIYTILEGKYFTGNATALLDIRDAASDTSVSVILGTDVDDGEGANVGEFLGRISRNPINRHPSRDRENFDLKRLAQTKADTTPYYLGTAANNLVEDFTDANLLLIKEKGYIFPRKYSGRRGFFWSSNSTLADPSSQDISDLNLLQVVNKAKRILSAVYTQYIDVDVALDPATGRLSLAALTGFQAAAQSAINLNMINAQTLDTNNVSGAVVSIDPLQDVQTTGVLKVNLQIVRRAIISKFEIVISAVNQLNA